MSEPTSHHPHGPDAVRPSRRRVLALFINGVGAAFGGALALLLGVFAARPARGGARERWVRAATLTDLVPEEPVPHVLSIPRADGWYRGRARETVFLVWSGERDVRAFSATCTHLGCQVAWDGAAKRFRCPCHGGAYDAQGRVVAGPPPRPLDRLDARVDAADNSVLVRL